jgi:hypothetical protein
MAMEPNALLQPSLQVQRPKSLPFSLQAQFLTAFFGGPVAALGMGLLNASRLDRLRRDAAWLGALLVLYVALAYGFVLSAAGEAVHAAAVDALGLRAPHYLDTAYALACFSIAAAAHRRGHQAAQLFGLAAPSPWKTGLILVAVGYAIARVWTLTLP